MKTSTKKIVVRIFFLKKIISARNIQKTRKKTGLKDHLAYFKVKCMP